MAHMILLGSDFNDFTCSRRAFSRARQRHSCHSKAASTADTVGTALQSHSVGVGPAICFDAGACDRHKVVECSVLVGVQFRTGSK